MNGPINMCQNFGRPINDICYSTSHEMLPTALGNILDGNLIEQEIIIISYLLRVILL